MPNTPAETSDRLTPFATMIGPRGLVYLVDTSRAMRERTGCEWGMTALVQGMLAAVEASEIDLSGCESHVEVQAVLLAHLVAGKRALEGKR